MFKHKESFFYLILGFLFLILTFQPFDFLDKPLGSDGYLFNIRVMLLIFGIFFILFPPSEPRRISSLGNWIINLIKSVRGSNTNQNIDKDQGDDFPDQPSFRE